MHPTSKYQALFHKYNSWGLFKSYRTGREFLALHVDTDITDLGEAILFPLEIVPWNNLTYP
jgi:hypothetical protein